MDTEECEGAVIRLPFYLTREEELLYNHMEQKAAYGLCEAGCLDAVEEEKSEYQSFRVEFCDN
ncbi:MAG: hypothetical protein HQL06_11400 [Nitrospirae bacterium]|nr:hypothetical protein [Nitrospirota bacterium]